jgi:hypothetical protein
MASGEEVVHVSPPIASPVASGGGLRYDQGKNRLDLLPPEWEWALGQVLTAGAQKYAERNWEQGMKHSKMIGCMKRHLAKFLSGEEYDHEIDPATGEDKGTQCHHLALVAWNALALMSYRLRKIGENDLPTTTTIDILNSCKEKAR